MSASDFSGQCWAGWLERLARGEWRTPIFYEIVSAEIKRRSAGVRPTVLDIGCGRGFDSEQNFQCALAEQAGEFIGIEPDPTIELLSIFTEVFRTGLEAAPIAAGSINVAYAVMVMEHVADPEAFWGRLYEVLSPGGVFVAFSVNGAHWFALLSRLLSLARLKSPYLNLVYGHRGTARYEDYPVYYRTNTRAQIKRWARGFSMVEAIPCGCVGTVAQYAPPLLRPAVHAVDRFAYSLSGEPINLIIRAIR